MNRNLLVGSLSLLAVAACGTELGAEDGVNSEVATSAVSGAINVSAGSSVALNAPLNLAPRPRLIDSFMDAISPVGTASAATWTCTTAALDPTFAGPGSYTLSPATCTVSWLDGKSGSSSWSSTFTLDYGASCDDTHPSPLKQAAGCATTRTTATGGNTRTVIGPDGNSYAVTHDTNGAGTGWDGTVSPAPGNGGVVATCGANGCSSGGDIVINGSHLTGTETPAGGSATTIWNHTVSTGTDGLTVTVAEGVPSVAGSVTVQHNLAKFTSTAVFNDVTWGSGLCCFPTSGSVTNTFANGTNAGKSETLQFSAACGEETLTTASGKTASITLLHCI
jgi:hypothetical protein